MTDDAIRRGDHDAIAKYVSVLEEELVDLMIQYQRPLLNFLSILVGDYDLASEFAQETFVRAYDNLRRGRPVSLSWLYKVGRNIAMDEYRHRQRVQETLPVLAQRSDQEPGALECDAKVRRTMEQLPPEEREILYLHVVDRLKTAEIAGVLGIRPGALRMRLLRARERFRQAWGDAS